MFKVTFHNTFTYHRHLNGYTFFFNGDSYWRYNEQFYQVDIGYPRGLAAWGGVPADVDAAFLWSDGFAYFFKGKLYFRYDNGQGKIQDGYARDKLVLERNTRQCGRSLQVTLTSRVTQIQY